MKNKIHKIPYEIMEIRLRHLQNQHSVIQEQYEKTTNEYLTILDEISKTNIKLLQEVKQRKSAEEELQKSLDIKDVLLREVHHRVKNNMQVISSLLQLQAERIEDEHGRDMFKESINRIHAMGLIHTLLYQDDNLSSIKFSEYIPSLCNTLISLYSTKGISIKVNTYLADIRLKLDTALPSALILNELITNSFKHAFPKDRNGEVTISMKMTKEYTVELKVTDNGIGIPSKVDWRNTDSLGLKLVTDLVERQLFGTIEHTSTEGTEFTIRFRNNS
ncbi:sensor histidine kinase [Candidatus Latescibacterota bacterium]